MKALYFIFGLLFVAVLIGGCAEVETPDESRSITFWGTANIKAEVIQTIFPANNQLMLKVLEVNDYSLDGATEISLFEGDEIHILVSGEWKSQTVCNPVEPPERIVEQIEAACNKNERGMIGCELIVYEPGDPVCNKNEEGVIECELCVKDESINPYEDWVANDLENGDIINIQVKREGSSFKYSEWYFGNGSSISLVE